MTQSDSSKRKCAIRILHDLNDTPEDGNVDVVVEMEDGTRYGATFFTLDNVRYLLAKFEESGECMNGLYFWTDGMVLVQRLNQWTIEQTIEGLIEEGLLEKALTLLGSSDSGTA